MRQLFFIMGICVIIANPAFADIYKCTVNGKLTFSDTPCAQGDKQEIIKLPGAKKPNGGGKGMSRTPLKTKPPKSAIDACFEHYKDRLLDPRDAYVVSGTWSFATQPNGRTYNELIVNARAKNKMGGFIPVEMYCAVTPEGDQIAPIMKMYDAFFNLDITPQ